MSLVLALLFWLAVATVVYAWLGYPLVLALVGRARARGGHVDADDGEERGRARSPSVSVVIAAFNEARVIREKLRTTLAQHYRWDRLDVVVVSDGSSDGTDEIVRAYPDPRVTLVRQWPRAGKLGRSSTITATPARAQARMASAVVHTNV
jgi:cellulose synthase/poly-beta-1,6-N-acetylglucosamine synthase-like glycosyltransferase